MGTTAVTQEDEEEEEDDWGLEEQLGVADDIGMFCSCTSPNY